MHAGARSIAGLFALLALAGRLGAAETASIVAPAPTVLAEVAMELVNGLDAVEPAATPLQHPTTATAPAGLGIDALPAGSWLFGAAPVTKTERLAFAARADRAEMYFDADGDGALEPGERVAPASVLGGITWFAVSGRVRQVVGEAVHEASVAMKVGIGPGEQPMAFNRLDAHRRGVASVGGRKVLLAVVDRTFRGWFSHLGRDALLVDVDGDSKLDSSEDSAERYRLGQPFPVGDRDVVVGAVGPLGSTLTLVSSSKPARRLASLALGAQAPAFSAPTVDGKTFELAAQRGRWVLLDFWASWCGPCRAEVPYLRRLREKLPALVVLGVSGDRQRASLQAYTVAEKVDWPQVFDEDGSVAGLYRVRSLPRSYLVAPDGTIAAKDLRGPALTETVEKLMATRAAAAP